MNEEREKGTGRRDSRGQVGGGGDRDGGEQFEELRVKNAEEINIYRWPGEGTNLKGNRLAKAR